LDGRLAGRARGGGPPPRDLPSRSRTDRRPARRTGAIRDPFGIHHESRSPRHVRARRSRPGHPPAMNFEFPPRLVEVASGIRSRLEAGLEPTLYYHGVHHTFDDVVPAVERIGRGEGVVAGDREILLAAAIFHDVGFLERYNGNEAIGARHAAEILPAHG